jgi:hypothetical protein
MYVAVKVLEADTVYPEAGPVLLTNLYCLPVTLLVTGVTKA